MDGRRFLAWAALIAMVGLDAALAETEAEYGAPERRAARPPLFAAEAAKTAVRLPPEVREERSFIRLAAANARFEAQASKLALSKSANTRVRAFAAGLVDEHKAAEVEFSHLLQARDMAMPMLENEQLKVLKRLGKASGSKFDRDYLEQVALKAHQEDIRQYEKASQSLKDPVLKAWVEQKLPALRYRVMTAENMRPKGVKVAGLSGAVPSGKRRPAVVPVAARLSESNSP